MAIPQLLRISAVAGLLCSSSALAQVVQTAASHFGMIYGRVSLAGTGGSVVYDDFSSSLPPQQGFGTKTGPGSLTEDDTTPAELVASHVFYNNSWYDGNNIELNSNDDNAIDPSKELLTAGASTFANYTSYSRGINGLMFDIARPSRTPEESDFVFQLMGTHGATPGGFVSPTAFAVVTGGGTGGTERVKFAFADGAISKQWLRITVGTGFNLAYGKTLWIGNAGGECGSQDNTNYLVNSVDQYDVISHYCGPNPPQSVDCVYDLNKDRLINATDYGVVQNNQTTNTDCLKQIIRPNPSVQIIRPDPPVQIINSLTDVRRPALSGTGRFIVFGNEISGWICDRDSDGNGWYDDSPCECTSTIFDEDGDPLWSNWELWMPAIDYYGIHVATVHSGDFHPFDEILRTTFSGTGLHGRTEWWPFISSRSTEPALSYDGMLAFIASKNLAGPESPGSDIDVYVMGPESWAAEKVSVDDSGEPLSYSTPTGDVIGANEGGPAISGDATQVAFVTDGGLANGRGSLVYVRDRQYGRTVCVSVDSQGEPPALDPPMPGQIDLRGCDNPALSATGRFVAFEAGYPDLVTGDTNNARDVFVHDRDTDNDGIFDEQDAIKTIRVSVHTDGTEIVEGGVAPSMSGDGRFVTFVEPWHGLGYVHDRDTDEDGVFDEPGATATMPVGLDVDGYLYALEVTISADGRYVAFTAHGQEHPSERYLFVVPTQTQSPVNVTVVNGVIEESGSATASFLPGSTITLQATPTPPLRLWYWSADTSPHFYCILEPSSDVTRFTVPKEDVTVTAQAAGVMMQSARADLIDGQCFVHFGFEEEVSIGSQPDMGHIECHFPNDGWMGGEDVELYGLYGIIVRYATDEYPDEFRVLCDPGLSFYQHKPLAIPQSAPIQ